MNAIIRAAQTAKKLHRNQKRKYTELPYILHVQRVAGRVACHPLATEDMVVAAFLHDTLEDTEYTTSDILNTFGSGVSSIVTGLTNTSKDSGEKRSVRKLMDARRLGSQNKEVKIIKLIDRIDNLRDIPNGEKFRTLYAKESYVLLDFIAGADDNLADEANELIKEILYDSAI